MSPVRSILLALWATLVGAVAQEGSVDLTDRLAGLQLARRHCVTCHLFPEPAAADLKTWREEILPRMKYRLGFSSPELERSTNIAILRQHHRIPLQPVLTEAEWMTLSRFYFAEAPKTPRPQPEHEAISLGGTPFRVVIPDLRLAQQSISAVAIDAQRKEIWIGEDNTRSLHRLSASGTLLETRSLSNTPVRLRLEPGGTLQVTGIGLLPPNDLEAGALLRVDRNRKGAPAIPTETLLQSLRRPVDAVSADFDGDGRPEWIVAEFGNHLGALSYHQPQGSTWKRRELFPLPGAVSLQTTDFDRDGRPDVLALIAQETESLLLFRNDGRGGFERRTLLQKPPQWGFSHVTTADFNGDGWPDVLVCNGDNGEFNSPPKGYHGVRLYLADRQGALTEHWSYPLHGAYGARAGDFDGDGDLDIAAISYFPDYAQNPREGFVYFQNLGNGSFRPSTIRECIAGRWMALDSGDLDGDGDLDLVLGSYTHGPTEVPEFLMKTWDSSRIPILILLNTTRP